MIFQSLLSTMKGNYLDIKLNLRPLVVLEEIGDVKKKFCERIVAGPKKKNSTIIDQEQKKFLFKLGLISNRTLDKSEEFTPLNGMGLNVKTSRFRSRKKTRNTFCSGLTSNTQVKEPNWACYFDKCSERKHLALRQLKLNPRICVKKWLGGERIINSRRWFQILEKELIPKTENHSFCKEKPKKHLLPSKNGVAGSPKQRLSLLGNMAYQEKYESLIMPELGQLNHTNNNKSHPISKRSLRSPLHSPNSLKSSRLSVQKTTEEKRANIDDCLRKGDTVVACCKELHICLKRWEGKKSIHVPKELRNIEDLLTVPAGSSHRACWKALEKPGSHTIM